MRQSHQSNQSCQSYQSSQSHQNVYDMEYRVAIFVLIVILLMFAITPFVILYTSSSKSSTSSSNSSTTMINNNDGGTNQMSAMDTVISNSNSDILTSPSPTTNKIEDIVSNHIGKATHDILNDSLQRLRLPT